eukprot:g4252.t1
MAATTLSQFYILSPRGDTIVSRDYRGDVPKGASEKFFRAVKFWSGGEDAPPAFNIDGINFLFIKQNSLFLACTTRFNVCPSMMLELLNRIARVIKDYCGVLSEESIRKNFILVYELLDEMLDFGYVQGTSTEQLKAYVYNDPLPVGPAAAPRVSMRMGKKTKHSSAVQKPISMRHERDKNKRNEIFVDILERLTVTFNSTGYIIASEIDGCIQMKSYLSGNPRLSLALNEGLQIGGHNTGGGIGAGQTVALDAANFHENVNLDDFEATRTMTINPPEGEFTVMNYRVAGDFHVPFRVFPFVEEMSQDKLELVIKVRADMEQKNYGSNVVVRFAVPKSTGTVSTVLDKSAGEQTCEYSDKRKDVVWKIKKFTGGSEQTLVCKIGLVQSSSSNIRKEIGPISLEFEIPMYNASRLQVRYLRIAADAKYKPLRWVRYVTQAASYMCRV